jgi:hypothetical protein
MERVWWPQLHRRNGRMGVEPLVLIAISVETEAGSLLVTCEAYCFVYCPNAASAGISGSTDNQGRIQEDGI